MRKPDFIIGGEENPYLLRWHILKSRWLSIYVHKMLRDDDDRALHDHRGFNISIILRGGYWEMMPVKENTGLIYGSAKRTVWRGPGSVVFRKATDAHRLMLPHEGAHSWSIFITGPTTRVWGFHCGFGFRPWYEFVDPNDRGKAGRGCD